MEKYVESKVSDIFQLKLVTKNIVLGFPGTQFDVFFWRSIQMFGARLLDFSVFLVY